MKFYIQSILLISIICGTACSTPTSTPKSTIKQDLSGLNKAYFASGCFWCVEAIFESVEGVAEAKSGYAGGKTKDPTYQSIGSGRTGHAESVEVYYDPEIVSYSTLLKVFFGSHDPTTLNRQGPDAGSQYRSAIFYQNEEEKDLAVKYVQKLKEDRVFQGEITTEIAALTVFYIAEDYHQGYEANNPNNPYVRSVSIPRLNKFKKRFPTLLKNGH